MRSPWITPTELEKKKRWIRESIDTLAEDKQGGDIYISKKLTTQEIGRTLKEHTTQRYPDL